MPGFLEWLETPAGRVPRISSQIGFADRLGACKVRWAIGRMNFMVPPGLYAIGAPTPESPVIVTANYKMTYDLVRRSLAGRAVWLLVLETYGINVWCAAGKGTFGTGEVVRRVTASRLAEVVTHRRLILPILGAAGVSAHQVASRCGFSVSYAAIRVDDLPEYLDNGMVTTPGMRQLTFSLYERLVLIPVEVMLELKNLVIVSGVVFLVCALAGTFSTGFSASVAYAGAVVSGTIAGPLLLPWLPGKSFAVKGATVGLLWAICCYVAAGAAWNLMVLAAALLILPAVSAFYTLNFTGCSTFTSRSGVRKEMRIGLPAMGFSIAAGLILLGLNAFV